MKISENTSISMPARNLISIIGACVVGAWFGFGVIERLNNIETKLQLMEKDLEAANTFIDGVPKGNMVSPQVQELYMLVEYLGENVEKLKEHDISGHITLRKGERSMLATLAAKVL